MFQQCQCAASFIYEAGMFDLFFRDKKLTALNEMMMINIP